jgi:hypothetical protein
VFTLSDEQLEAVKSAATGRGANAVPEYLDPVKEAYETGDMKGITLTGDNIDKAATNVANKLRNAAARLTRDLGIATYDPEGKRPIGGKIVVITTKVLKDHPKFGNLLAFTAAAEDFKPRKVATPEATAPASE